MPRCPKGSRRSKKTGECEKKSDTKKSKRCKKGTRKNKQGECVSYSKTSTSPNKLNQLQNGSLILSIVNKMRTNGIPIPREEEIKLLKKYANKKVDENKIHQDITKFMKKHEPEIKKKEKKIIEMIKKYEKVVLLAPDFHDKEEIDDIVSISMKKELTPEQVYHRLSKGDYQKYENIFTEQEAKHLKIE